MSIGIHSHGVGDTAPATVLASTVDTTVARQLESMTTNVSSGAMPPWSQADALTVLTQLAKFQCGINGSADSGCSDGGVGVAQKYAQQYAQFAGSTVKSPVVAAPDVQVAVKTPENWGVTQTQVPVPVGVNPIPVNHAPVSNTFQSAPATTLPVTATTTTTTVPDSTSPLMWALLLAALYFTMRN